MAGPPVPPPARPEPPAARETGVDETPALTPEERRERRQNRWLLIVTIVALAAAAAAGYAIVQAEDTKDESREEARGAVNQVQADFEVLRQQVTQRLDSVESQVQDSADAETQRKLQQDLEALDKQVKDLEDQSGDDLSSRIDDLEQRVDDLEQKD